MIRKIIDNVFLIWLVSGLAFWGTWVVVAPAYDDGIFGGVVFLGAYTLGVPFLLATILLESLAGHPLSLGVQLLAILVGACPPLLAHRLFRRVRGSRSIKA